ncbi:MAG: VOC family protein [Ardenticatenales bacterium]
MNAINWFEIPVENMQRAITFYSTVLGGPITPMEGSDGNYAALPSGENGVGGALAFEETRKPAGGNGVAIYLNGGDDLAVMLGRVAGAGGKVTTEKHDIGEFGFIGFFTDTEGNSIGLHSNG